MNPSERKWERTCGAMLSEVYRIIAERGLAEAIFQRLFEIAEYGPPGSKD